MTYSNLKDIELLGSAVTEWNEMLNLDSSKLNLWYGLILGKEPETRYLTSMSFCFFSYEISYKIIATSWDNMIKQYR